jgi:hypothetical protein
VPLASQVSVRLSWPCAPPLTPLDDPMANEERVALLKQGVAAWNPWRNKNRDIRPDLSGANLRWVNLCGAEPHRADLSAADLRAADLRDANLSGANLHRANLSEALLLGAFLSGANLRTADLCVMCVMRHGRSARVCRYPSRRLCARCRRIRRSVTGGIGMGVASFREFVRTQRSRARSSRASPIFT